MRTVPDFPIPGIPFPDITSLLETDATLNRDIVDAFADAYRAEPPDCIVAIESFVYVFGAPLAYLLGTRLVLARRAGKLPRHSRVRTDGALIDGIPGGDGCPR